MTQVPQRKTQQEMAELWSTWLVFKGGLWVGCREVDWLEVKQNVRELYGDKGLRRIENKAQEIRRKAMLEAIAAAGGGADA